MTDNEIVKAFECCADEMGCKKGCPCFDPKAKGSCCKISKIGIEKTALDLINRQKAEIEKLKKENDELDVANVLLTVHLQNAKAEAIKEFVSELIKKAGYESYGHGRTVVRRYLIDVDCFENIVKEKVGDV